MAYRLARVVIRYVLSIYFRVIEVEHAEQIPSHGPVLIVANHLNALIDALVVIAVLDRPVTLTAKSTLGRNPVLRFLMNVFGVVELHRRQDVAEGADPSKNADQLVRLRERLSEGGLICLFPEGISHSKPSLQPLRTGAARIAIDFASSGGAGLRIVPLGIHYEAKSRLRTSVWLRFGEPVDVAQYLVDREEEKVEHLTLEIRAGIENLVLSFSRRREALLVDWAAEVLLSAETQPEMLGYEPSSWPAKVSLMDRLQEGLDRIDGDRSEDLAGLVGRLRAYRVRLRRLGISAREVGISMNPLRALFFVVRELELLVFGLPILLAASLQHGLPFALVRTYTRRASSDPDHWASNAVFSGIVIWPVCLVIESILVALFAGGMGMALFLLSAPYFLSYAARYLERWTAIRARATTFLTFLISRGTKRSLERESAEIATEIRRLAATTGLEVHR